MTIYDVNLAGTAASESGRAQESQRTQSGTGANTGAVSRSSGDRIDLSSTLNSISQALSADSSGRAAKIEALAAQYRSGAYQPNSLAIGRGMIQEALVQEGG
jgi:anti-sigma28 factor (negative regulator of flagellin synthesis)